MDGKLGCLQLSDKSVVMHMNLTTDVRGKEDSRSFQFDQCMRPHSTNQDAFWVAGAPLVKSLLAGISGTFLCYGQTGSGKTHTMFGPPGWETNGSEPGVAVLIMQQLFLQKEKQCTVHLSVVDIYNEKMYDLLSDHRVTMRLHKKRGAESTAARTPVENFPAMLALIRAAVAKRITASTLMNDHSSRSHLCLTIHVECLSVDGTTNRAQLHLVDLAGSEKVSKTGSRHARLKEAANINTSLLALGLVIKALSERTTRKVKGSAQDDGRKAEGGGDKTGDGGAGTVGDTESKDESTTKGKGKRKRKGKGKKRRKPIWQRTPPRPHTSPATATRKNKQPAPAHAPATGPRERHIPYRSSVLTRLLQGSLGGDGRTVIMINCSPSTFNAEETLSTLRCACVSHPHSSLTSHISPPPLPLLTLPHSPLPGSGRGACESPTGWRPTKPSASSNCAN